MYVIIREISFMPAELTLKPPVDLWYMPRSLHQMVVVDKTLKYK
jgi:hypothetical protein